MPCFLRTFPAPEVRGDYSAFHAYVRNDFRRCCAYCLMHEFWAGGESNFELDHFRPMSRFPAEAFNFSNLYYCCHVCNLRKWMHWPSRMAQEQGAHFVDLCRDDFAQHYRLLPDSRLEPLTAAAHYTLLTLRLNSEHLVQLRAFGVRYSLRLDMPPP